MITNMISLVCILSLTNINNVIKILSNIKCFVTYLGDILEVNIQPSAHDTKWY